MAVNSGQPCSTWWAAHLLPPFPLTLGVLPSPTVLQKDTSLEGRGGAKGGLRVEAEAGLGPGLLPLSHHWPRPLQ